MAEISRDARAHFAQTRRARARLVIAGLKLRTSFDIRVINQERTGAIAIASALRSSW